MEETLGGLGGNEGNTHNLISKASKQAPKRKQHFFTWNNYTEDDIGGLLDYFNKHATKYAFQEEIAPSTGTPHLQGMVIFPVEKRSTVWDAKSKGHYERLKKDDGEYQLKEESRKPGGRQWTKGFPKPIQHSILWNTWNTWLLDEIQQEPNNRRINWIWSNKGKMGKTSITRFLVDKHKAQFCSGGKYTDIMNLIYHTDMDTCRCVIFTLPREHKNHISYSALESVKDGLVCNMKSYQNGSKIFNPPHIIIFANYPPEIENLSKDRWNILQLDFMFREN